MRATFTAVYTALVLLQVIILINGLPTCNTTDTKQLECLTCSDLSSNRCTNSTGADQFTTWQSSKSNEGEINTTRYHNCFKSNIGNIA